MLEGLGEGAEAEQVLERAVEVSRTRPGDPLGSLAIADLLRLRHLRGDEVGELLGEARGRFPDNQLIAFIEGRYLIDHERFEEALARFRELLAVDQSAAARQGAGL